MLHLTEELDDIEMYKTDVQKTRNFTLKAFCNVKSAFQDKTLHVKMKYLHMFHDRVQITQPKDISNSNIQKMPK